MMTNTCYLDLQGFYRKSEVAFLGEEIDFKLMTRAQLDQALLESIAIYNKLYPPPKKPKFQRYMNTAIKVGLIAGCCAIAAGAVLAAYGVSAGQAVATVSPALKASAAKGSVLANIQKGATVVSTAGKMYGKATGDTPEGLVKAADLVSSPTALDAMEYVAKDQLADMGKEVQADNEAANAALRERLKKEQEALADKLRQEAGAKAEAQGRPAPAPKQPPDMMQIVAIATPFILFMLR